MAITPVLHRCRESLCHWGRWKGQCKDDLPQHLASGTQNSSREWKRCCLVGDYQAWVSVRSLIVLKSAQKRNLYYVSPFTSWIVGWAAQEICLHLQCSGWEVKLVRIEDNSKKCCSEEIFLIFCLVCGPNTAGREHHSQLMCPSYLPEKLFPCHESHWEPLHLSLTTYTHIHLFSCSFSPTTCIVVTAQEINFF